MLKWLLGKPEAQKEPEQPKPRKSLFSTHEFDMLDPDRIRNKVADGLNALQREQPAFHGDYAMDDSSNGIANFKMYANGINTVSDAVVGWYATQGFIGAQLCGIIAQNWLVNKACAMPADDAIRKGYNIVTTDGDELDPEAVKILKSYDKSLRLQWNMREFIRKGRIFGVRVAMFKVISTDPEYYEKPFNIDGVTPGSYKGIVQVDPYWTAPMLDGASASQPDTLHFYEPTWWIINGKKIHRSHLIIFRHSEPVDVLKPQYIYGGIPLTQQIMERVYAAERTSNEAPQLAMSKRTTVWLTDMEAVMANTNDAIGRLQTWSQFRDNYGIKIGDKEGDEFNQFDTSLADFDSLIMTQYQLVAAIAGVPATKLLGTSPKGFNATGDYEEASYHELLESIQAHDLTPLAERHHQLVIKAYVEPQLKIRMDVETTLNWLPLDTPTAKELADTNYIKAQTGQVLVTSGALSSEDERQRIATDKQSGYNEMGLEDQDMPDEGEELADEDLLDTQDQNFDDPEVGSGPIGEKLAVAQDADDEKWITVNGAHILIDGKGNVKEGPAGLKKSKFTSAKGNEYKTVGGNKVSPSTGQSTEHEKHAILHEGKEAGTIESQSGTKSFNQSKNGKTANHKVVKNWRITVPAGQHSIKTHEGREYSAHGFGSKNLALEHFGNVHKPQQNTETSQEEPDHESGKKDDIATELSKKGASKEAQEAHIEAGKAYQAENKPIKASRHFEKAFEIGRALGEHKPERKPEAPPPTAQERLNDDHGAGTKADAAYALSSKGNSMEAFNAHNEAAEAYQGEGKEALAKRHRDTAREIFTALRYKK